MILKEDFKGKKFKLSFSKIEILNLLYISLRNIINITS